MKKRNLLLVYISAFLLFTLSNSSCKVKKTEAPAPDKGVAKNVNRPLSTINIPISLSISEIESSINKQFQGVLYNDVSFENNNNDNLILKVTRIADFKITGAGDKFNIVLPLEIYVKGRLKKDFFSMFDQNIGIDQSKDALFRINVIINTRLSLNQDWDLITKSEAGFQWRERPYLELGPVKIPIGSVIESVLNNQISEINKKIDAEVTRLVKLKPFAEQYWNQIQQPVLVNEAYKAYLQIVPEFISLSSINTKEGKLNINLGFRSDILIKTGEKPVLSASKPLPKLQTQNRADSTFHLYFDSELSYEYATELAKKEFAGKTFTFENGQQKVTINDISIFNNGDKLGIQMNVNGSATSGIFKKKFKGNVFALGVPVYDSRNQVLFIKDFDFDVKSKDVLIGTAEFLLKGNFKKQIESKLRYPLKENLSNVRLLAQDALNNTKINNIRLNGKIEKIEPMGVYLNEKSIQVIVQSEGSLSVRLTSQ